MGGGGGQKTTSEAKYPAEFAPLAESARKQIEELQQALPLVSHARFQPAGVAGMSPIEEFVINEMVMRTPYLPASFENLMELPGPVGEASQGAVKAGKGSRGAAGSLSFLSDFLGRDVRAPEEPTTTQPFQVLTRMPTPETAFPGLTRETVETARPNIATAPVAMIQPPPQAPSGPIYLPAPPSNGPPIASQVPPGFVVVPPGFPGGHAGEMIPRQVWEIWATMPGVPLEQVMAMVSGGAGTGSQGTG